MAEDKREPTRALDKASRVVDALAAENGLSPADIADACDIPRSSVYRVLPLHAGAAGRVALAYFEDADAERYLAGAPFPAYNENTLVSVEQLREDIRLTRERGYALSDEDVTLGVGAVGVPIVDNESGRVIASLSAGGFVDEVLATQESLAALLHDGVHEIQAA